jgi:tetratricopeptide (TPR) repeat protein
MSPTAPSAIVADVDGELETIILELLQKDPVRRIDSATTLVGRLTEQPPSEAIRLRARPDAVSSWEGKINRSIARRKTLFWVFLVLCIIPSLVVGHALILFGVYNVYLHQSRLRGASRTLLGLFLMMLGFFTHFVTTNIKYFGLAWMFKGAPPTQNDIIYIKVILIQIYLVDLILYILEVFMIYNFAKWRLLERDRFLMSSLRTSGADSRDLIEVLHNYIQRNPEELFVRQRLAELYSFTGRLKEAVVEAKLVLSIDPFNFSASLLLGESYARLGLREQAVAVCDGYLAISPQSFEFAELRQRCKGIKAGTIS